MFCHVFQWRTGKTQDQCYIRVSEQHSSYLFAPKSLSSLLPRCSIPSAFQSIFSSCRSLAFHLISSQFPPPFCHLIMWASAASHLLVVNLASLLNPDCFTLGAHLQVNLLIGSHLWLNRTFNPATVKQEVINHLPLITQILPLFVQPWYLSRFLADGGLAWAVIATDWTFQRLKISSLVSNIWTPVCLICAESGPEESDFFFVWLGFWGCFRGGWSFCGGFVYLFVCFAERRKTNQKSKLGSKSRRRARKGLQAAHLHPREWTRRLLCPGSPCLYTKPHWAGAGRGRRGLQSSCNSTSLLLSLQRASKAPWQLPPSSQALPANCSLFVPFS